MSPRPGEYQENAFEAAVRQARAGELAEAVEAIVRAVADLGRAQVPAAANALAEVAGIAEAAADLGVAERAIEQAVNLAPKYPDLQYRRGCLLLRSKRDADARRAFESAIALNPGYIAARLELAMLDARAGMVGDALEALRALSTQHDVPDLGTFRRGLSSLERAEWDEADSLLRHALDLPDSGVQRDLLRVHERLEQGHAADAAAALRALVQLHPGYPDLHALLGRAHIALGHYDDAILALSRALEIKPDYHAARVLLAQALESLGQRSQAQDQVALVLQHEPNHQEALQASARWNVRSARGASRSAAH